MAKGLVKRGIKAGNVWYRVNMYTNPGPEAHVSSAVHAVTLGESAVASRHVATAEVITRQARTCAT